METQHNIINHSINNIRKIKYLIIYFVFNLSNIKFNI